jgi:hypothetical protein
VRPMRYRPDRERSVPEWSSTDTQVCRLLPPWRRRPGPSRRISANWAAPEFGQAARALGQASQRGPCAIPPWRHRRQTLAAAASASMVAAMLLALLRERLLADCRRPDGWDFDRGLVVALLLARTGHQLMALSWRRRPPLGRRTRLSYHRMPHHRLNAGCRPLEQMRSCSPLYATLHACSSGDRSPYPPRRNGDCLSAAHS